MIFHLEVGKHVTAAEIFLVSRARVRLKKSKWCDHRDGGWGSDHRGWHRLEQRRERSRRRRPIRCAGRPSTRRLAQRAMVRMAKAREPVVSAMAAATASRRFGAMTASTTVLA